MQLTKEQIDALEEGAANGLCSVKGPLLSELLRGYRASSGEAEHLALVINEIDKTLAAYRSIITTYENMQRLNRARLAVLKGEG